MFELLHAVVGAVLFGAIGLVLVLRPRAIQRFAIRYYEQNIEGKKWLPFAGQVRSRLYPISLLITGVLSLAASALLLLVVIRTLRSRP